MSALATSSTPLELPTGVQKKYDIIRSVGEECVSEVELKALLLKKTELAQTFNLYDGFEPSGRVHIAQGAFKALNVNKCTSNGGTFVFWVADWFALMNDKMSGDLDKIKVVGEYLIEVWRSAGMDLSDGKVIFKWASDEISKNAGTYWPKMLDIASKFNVTRIKKCCQIMGRLEGSLTAAQVLYPLMQCTDVFFLKADVCQLGVDQRKVNMLAREYCDACTPKMKFKPVILSHHMLYGLKEGQEKMSKSDADSAIFMEDTVEDVERKIINAFCPRFAKDSAGAAGVAGAAVKNDAQGDDAGKESMSLIKDDLKNPCLDYIKYIVLGPEGSNFLAGEKVYTEFDNVKDDFVSGVLSEDVLKKGLIIAINKALQPVRDHFSNDDNARELLEKVRSYKREDMKVLDRKFRRNVLEGEGKVVKEGSHIVFVPAPTGNPTLQNAVDIITQLRSIDNASGSRGDKVLYLSNWSASVTSSCSSDVKVIQASFDVLINSIRTLSPESMEGVKIVVQSDAILSDPSMYWISVINIGRFFTLNTVQEGFKDSDGVGNVIARLMLVADVISLNPASVCYISDEGKCMARIEAGIISKYYAEASIPLTPPVLTAVKRIDVSLLQTSATITIPASDKSEYFLLDDPKVAAKSKMKKAFCDSGNVDFCPAITIASVFALTIGTGSILISRTADNGGDVTYTTSDSMLADFSSGSLHPGDLKNAAGTVMFEVLDKLDKGMKADKPWAAAGKTLKAFIKKSSKK